MEFGMPFLLETNTLEECVNLCKELGLQFIELNMNFPQCQLEEISTDDINAFCEEMGIYFTIHVEESLNVCDFNPRVKKAYLDTMLECIALAKKIKAPIINMHLAEGIYITLPNRKTYLFNEYRDSYLGNMKTFRDLCEKAIGESGIIIAIENTNGFQDHEKIAVEILLESQCFGLTLDIGHSHVVGDCDLPLYDRYKERLVHMHAHDAKGKKNHLGFGNGEIDLRQRLRMAKEANARVVLEVKTIEALKDTVKCLQRYL